MKNREPPNCTWDLFPQNERQVTKFNFQVMTRFMLFKLLSFKMIYYMSGLMPYLGPKSIISLRNSFVFYWFLICSVSYTSLLVPWRLVAHFVRTGLICCKVTLVTFGGLRISKQLPSGWPLITPAMHDLWPQQCDTLWPGFLLSNLVAIGDFLAIWTLVDTGWPMYDLWSQQCIMLWSGVLPTKFSSHKAFLSNLTHGWPQLTPAWPLTPNNALHFGQGFFLPNLVAKGHF